MEDMSIKIHTLTHAHTHTPVWYAVTHHVVDGGADRFGETPIVKWGGVGIVADRFLMDDEVYLVCRHANLGEGVNSPNITSTQNVNKHINAHISVTNVH